MHANKIESFWKRKKNLCFFLFIAILPLKNIHILAFQGVKNFVNGDQENNAPFGKQAIKKDIKEGLLLPIAWVLTENMRFFLVSKPNYIVPLILFGVASHLMAGLFSRWVYEKKGDPTYKTIAYYGSFLCFHTLYIFVVEVFLRGKTRHDFYPIFWESLRTQCLFHLINKVLQ